MRFFSIILLIISLQFPFASFAEDVKTIYVSASVNNNAVEIKKMLEEVLPKNTPVIYTIVPRGLVVSIKEETFFKGESPNINCSGANVLNGMISVLKKIDNNCTVESHTEGHNNENNYFHSNWEMSLARADSITDYLVYCGKIPSERIFPIGFGEFMPFKDNVSATEAGFDRRIDFVIFDYEYERD